VIVIEPGGIQSEWGYIAMENLAKTSGDTVYEPMAKKLIASMNEIDKKIPGPQVITHLIKKAISAKKPATRYSGGYMAKPLLFLRKILSDRMLDGLLMSQLK